MVNRVEVWVRVWPRVGFAICVGDWVRVGVNRVRAGVGVRVGVRVKIGFDVRVGIVRRWLIIQLGW